MPVQVERTYCSFYIPGFGVDTTLIRLSYTGRTAFKKWFGPVNSPPQFSPPSGNRNLDGDLSTAKMCLLTIVH